MDFNIPPAKVSEILSTKLSELSEEDEMNIILNLLLNATVRREIPVYIILCNIVDILNTIPNMPHIILDNPSETKH